MSPSMSHPHWPLWDIRIRTPRLELRPVHEPDIEALVDLIAGGVHDPAEMPFLQPFTDLPPPERERSSYRYFLGVWARWDPESWELPFAVVVDGEVVGIQSIEADRFPVRRTVVTGSWLGLSHQRRGHGTEMRAAVLEFAFRGLGAVRAQTSAYTETVASRRVSAKLGYVDDGWNWESVRGQRRRNLRFAMDAADWLTSDNAHSAGITIEGLGPEALDQFGLL
jgi:RimJ/RimL family protein N-acetyltransferase